MSGQASGVTARVMARIAAKAPSRAKLAVAAGLSEDAVGRYLSQTEPTRRVDLDHLVRMCDAANLSPDELMGALWPEYSPTSLHRQLSALRAENDILRAARGWPNGVPTPTVVFLQRVVASSRWGVSYLPLSAGPDPETVMRSEDVFAVALMDGRELSLPFSGRRRLFLREFGPLPPGIGVAAPDMSAISSRLPAGPLSVQDSTRRPIYLTAPVFSAERPVASRPMNLTGAPGRGVAVVSIRLLANPGRLAAILARALGWELQHTSRLAHDIGQAPEIDAAESVRRANNYRNLAFEELLASPRELTVLAHAGTLGGGATHALFRSRPGVSPFIVLLSDSDRILAESLVRPVSQSGRLSGLSFHELQALRDSLRIHVERLATTGDGMVIDCDLPWGPDERPADDEETQRRWQRSASQARQALQQILKLGGLRRESFVVRDFDAWRLLSWKSPVRWHGPNG